MAEPEIPKIARRRGRIHAKFPHHCCVISSHQCYNAARIFGRTRNSQERFRAYRIRVQPPINDSTRRIRIRNRNVCFRNKTCSQRNQPDWHTEELQIWKMLWLSHFWMYASDFASAGIQLPGSGGLENVTCLHHVWKRNRSLAHRIFLRKPYPWS